MATRPLQLMTLAIATASLALPACGGDDDSTSSSGDDRAQFREAALEFAECMRRNGVDMPDPAPDGGLLLREPREERDQPTYRRAQQACRKYLEDARPPELSEEDQREFRERALSFARCMREHGIDVPDPTFGGRGSVQQRLGEGVDPIDPAFQDAQRDCARFAPGFEEGS